MRGTNDSKEVIARYIKDEDGGCLVSTPDGDMNTKDMGEYGVPCYLTDGREIFYPMWCDW